MKVAVTAAIASGVFSYDAYSGIKLGDVLRAKYSSQNNTKRTSKAFEGRANAEFVERALGDHDLDK